MLWEHEAVNTVVYGDRLHAATSYAFYLSGQELHPVYSSKEEIAYYMDGIEKKKNSGFSMQDVFFMDRILDDYMCPTRIEDTGTEKRQCNILLSDAITAEELTMRSTQQGSVDLLGHELRDYIQTLFNAADSKDECYRVFHGANMNQMYRDWYHQRHIAVFNCNQIDLLLGEKSMCVTQLVESILKRPAPFQLLRIVCDCNERIRRCYHSTHNNMSPEKFTVEIIPYLPIMEKYTPPDGITTKGTCLNTGYVYVQVDGIYADIYKDALGKFNTGTSVYNRFIKTGMHGADIYMPWYESTEIPDELVAKWNNLLVSPVIRQLDHNTTRVQGVLKARRI